MTKPIREKGKLSRDQMKILRDAAKGLDLTGAYTNGPHTSRDISRLFDVGLLTWGHKITDLGRAAIKTGTYDARVKQEHFRPSNTKPTKALLV